MKKPDSYWKKKLTPKQYKILRERSTELPFTGKLLREKRERELRSHSAAKEMPAEGNFVCAGCGNVLFESDTKFESGSGWPSFYDVSRASSVKLKEDKSSGMKRIEVICKKCGGHLGHVFEDGPKEKTGKRYCINYAALDFVKGK